MGSYSLFSNLKFYINSWNDNNFIYLASAISISLSDKGSKQISVFRNIYSFSAICKTLISDLQLPNNVVISVYLRINNNI